MHNRSIDAFVSDVWDESIVPELCNYIKIPNKSPAFDPDWEPNGYMNAAVELLERWCHTQPIRDMTLEVLRLEGRTPLLFIDIPGATDDVVLLYGHYDKQPEFSGWEDGLDPWTPVLKDGRLYGRGGADDGYALFGSLTAIRALQQHGVDHAHCIIIIEGCEESGSFDLPFYIDELGDRLGAPDLVVCLDAECGNYDQLWCTTSLRGNVTGILRVDVLTEGVHSGAAGGIVPSHFRIHRQLVGRVEEEQTGKILLLELHAEIPSERRAEVQLAADVLGDSIYRKFPWAIERPVARESAFELLLNNTWRPSLSITGAEGLPALRDAGNVQLPHSSLKLSFRLPPTCDAVAAGRAVTTALEANTPPMIKASFRVDSAMQGWSAPAVAPWLAESMQKASQEYFRKPSLYMGTGGTIPFMAMLGERFPDAQFLVTGVLGPKSNAHGPNEFLHIGTGKRLTCCVAQVLKDHCARRYSTVSANTGSVV